MARLFGSVNAFIAANDLAGETPPAPGRLAQRALRLEMGRGGIRTVVWATGYGRDYSWLDVPVRDVRGDIVHEGGIAPAAGLYVLGLRFLRRRKSNFIDGVGRDAEEIADHIAAYLRLARRVAA